MPTNDIGQKLADFRDALPFLDAQYLKMASDVLLAELEAMPAAAREPYRDDIAGLISALESRILTLAQETSSGSSA